MSLNHIIFVLIFVTLIASCQTPQNSDSVVDAKIDSAMAANEKISPTNSDFLIQMAEARLINLAAGELAEKQGSIKAVKAYGRKMIMEQDILIEEIRSLAQMNGVTLPKEISADKNNELTDLKKLKGRKFDKQFFALAKRNHERDLKWFRDVKVSDNYSNDPSIGAYAKNRLPMIEEQLAQLQKLQKK